MEYLNSWPRHVICGALVCGALVSCNATPPPSESTREPAEPTDISISAPAAAEDTSVRAVTYSPHAAHYSCHMNMGPTGAAAWMRGYHFVVVSIQQGSPAHEKLMLADVVTGVDGIEFGPDADPRITLGDAIGKAEATGEPMTLSVLRRGRSASVAISLPKIGAYSSTWPADCGKSRRILDDACRSLIDAQLPNGHMATDGATGTFLSGLLLLATGEAKYADAARRAAHNTASLDLAKIDYNNWALGYGGMLLAEYYLATGDDSVLESLQKAAKVAGEGQMLCGSWGHKSPAGGYGAMNQPGLACAIMLVLADECGVEVDPKPLGKAVEFFSRYAELGGVPYGDHWPRGSLDDNGKSSAAAVMCYVAGMERETSAFADSVADSYWLREEGHTGGYFSLMWGPLAASLAGEEKLQKFLDYQKWYYDLSRHWTGAITMLPYREALTRFDNSGYIEHGGDFCTGGMALVYALPRKRLRILGAPRSVFGAELSGELEEARDLYLERKWKECDAALAAMDEGALETADEKRWLRQLVSERKLAKESTDHVLMEIGSNLDGAAYRASEQYAALKRFLGDEGDERFAELDKRFANGTTAWFVREGKLFYEKWEGFYGFAVRSWVPQGRQAKRFMEGLPTLRLPIWEPLSPTSEMKPQEWRSELYEKDQAPPPGWEKPGFDDSEWRRGEGIFTAFQAEAGEKLPKGGIAARRRFMVDDTEGAALRVRLRTVRPALTKVYLNGTLVVDAVRGQRGGYASIGLDDRALSLLKKGENLLAVTSTAQGKGGNHLDVGLEINRVGLEKRTLPIMRDARLYRSDRPDGDETLRVTETRDKFRKALKEKYDAKSVDDLLKDLGGGIAYYRGLAENALVAKGLEGVRPALALHDSEDWRVRASVCGVVKKALGEFRKAKNEEGLKLVTAQIPNLIARVSDEHFWVRTMASTALADLGPEAKDAIPALEENLDHPVEWVRQTALGAIRRIAKDPETKLKAVAAVVKEPNSSYWVTRNALSALKEHTGEWNGRLDVLVCLIRNHPEGGGGRLLSESIDLACKLDPDGKVMIPVLIEAVEDKTHLSRQRGNPWGKAIAALGAYGEKAAAAVPALEALLAAEDKKSKGQHDAARKAIAAITGEPLEEANDKTSP